MALIDLNFGIHDKKRQPMTYAKCLLPIIAIFGTFYFISLSCKTLDRFFPVAVSLLPGILSVIIMSTFLLADLGFVFIYFNIKTQYNNLVIFLTTISILISFTTGMAYVGVCGRTQYRNYCCSAFVEFSIDHPDSLESLWINDKLKIGSGTATKVTAKVRSYINGRTTHASIFILSIFILYLLLSLSILYQHYLESQRQKSNTNQISQSAGFSNNVFEEFV